MQRLQGGSWTWHWQLFRGGCLWCATLLPVLDLEFWPYAVCAVHCDIAACKKTLLIRFSCASLLQFFFEVSEPTLKLWQRGQGGQGPQQAAYADTARKCLTNGNVLAAATAVVNGRAVLVAERMEALQVALARWVASTQRALSGLLLTECVHLLASVLQSASRRR